MFCHTRMSQALLTSTLVGALLITMIAPRTVLGSSPLLRRYPYLTDVVGRYATINWATDRSASVAFVRWGKVGTEPCTAHTVFASKTNLVVNSVLAYQWKALLNLTPGAQYCYRVYLGTDPEVDLLDAEPSPQFWTQVPTGSTAAFAFAVFGDWGAVDATGANPHQANVLQQIAASGARFAVTTGDNTSPAGTQKVYGDMLQTGPGLSAVFGPTFWKVAGSSIPIFPAIGNHGFSAPDVNHPHLMNWPQDRAVALSGGRYDKELHCCFNNIKSAEYPGMWYAFDAGLARFYVLHAAWADNNVGTASDYKNDYDYHWAPTSAQYQWLANDLATHPRAVKFAFFHYPLYADSSTQPSDTYLQGANSLEGLLSRYGVSIAFSGHAQFYQRNRKPHPDSVITYVSGGGGDNIATIGSPACSVFNAYGIGWSNPDQRGTACGSAPAPQTIEQVYHFLLVRIEGTTVTVTPTDELGRTFDVRTYQFAASPDNQAPTTPETLTAQALDAGRVRLTWSAATDNTGVAGYSIYRDGVLIDTVANTTFNYIDTTAVRATTYHYTVAAFDALGNHSAPTNAAITTTPEWFLAYVSIVHR